MIVSGHMARLKKAVAADPKATRAAEAIETAAPRGQSLTRQLLRFARRQPVNPVVVDPAACIAAMRARSRRRAARRARPRDAVSHQDTITVSAITGTFRAARRVARGACPHEAVIAARRRVVRNRECARIRA
jgi:hypothetical protein